MRGDSVLRVLVELTAAPASEQLFERAASSYKIAYELDPRRADGLAVAGALRRLVDAGLVGRGPRARRLADGRIKSYRGSGSTVYSPTARGREVDALLASATAARGGTFRPLVELGLTQRELLALR